MPPATARYSLVTVLTLALLMVIARQWAPYWDTHNVQAILTWDALGYYIYLPAHFIYDDLRTMAFVPKMMADYAPTNGFYQAFQVPGGPSGHLVTKYPIGLAILEAPFFWIGHALAKALGYPADGFSAPYQASIAFGGIAYAVAGLGLLRRVLLTYFSDRLTALTLGLMVLGTNYFQYAVYDVAMAHSACFTLYALLLWSTIRWHQTPRVRWAVSIGLALGLLVVVRPSEMIAVLLPLLWGLDSKAALPRKLALARRHWPQLAVAAAVGLAALSPQLLYWKWATGHWLFYSYEDQGFSFLRPHLRQVLFSFRKGWLVYTPLMVLALVGFWPLWRAHRAVAVPVLVFAAINLWVVAAWDIWWYGGSFGQRAMVQSYAALSLPLAALLGRWPGSGERATGSAADQPAGVTPAWRTVAAGPVLLLLVLLNLFQIWQYMFGLITLEDMTSSYWRAIFLNAQPTQADYARLDVRTVRPGRVVDWTTRIAAQSTFDALSPTEGGAPGEGVMHSTAYRLVRQEREYSPALETPVSALAARPGAWLRGGGYVWSDWGAWGARLVIEIRRGEQTVAWYGLRLHNNGTLPQRWSYVYADIPLPPDALPTDVVRIYGWALEGASPCLLDDLTLEVAERRER